MLPISKYKNEIIETVRNHAFTIVSAETGSGKSTQIPQYLANYYSQIVVTEPRIISSKDYVEYLYEILRNNNVGFIYKEAITKQELEKLQEDYFVFSNTKISNGEYDNATLTIYNELIKQNFYANGIINCPYIENENIVDNLTLIPKTLAEIL